MPGRFFGCWQRKGQRAELSSAWRHKLGTPRKGAEGSTSWAGSRTEIRVSNLIICGGARSSLLICTALV